MEDIPVINIHTNNKELAKRQIRDFVKQQFKMRDNKMKDGGWVVCPKCNNADIDWYILTSTFHKPETKIGKCKKCGYELTTQDKLNWMKQRDNKNVQKSK